MEVSFLIRQIGKAILLWIEPWCLEPWKVGVAIIFDASWLRRGPVCWRWISYWINGYGRNKFLSWPLHLLHQFHTVMSKRIRCIMYFLYFFFGWMYERMYHIDSCLYIINKMQNLLMNDPPVSSVKSISEVGSIDR